MTQSDEHKIYIQHIYYELQHWQALRDNKHKAGVWRDVCDEMINILGEDLNNQINLYRQRHTL
jgi:hypothetical protein